MTNLARPWAALMGELRDQLRSCPGMHRDSNGVASWSSGPTTSPPRASSAQCDEDGECGQLARRAGTSPGHVPARILGMTRASPCQPRAGRLSRRGSRESVVGVHVGGRLAHIPILVHRAELPLRRRIGSSVAGEWVAKRCVSRAATLKKTSWTL
jgi:hypothetical protein